MADEQAGTLAFLQSFYTDVTLYMPFEAHEREPLRVVTEAAPQVAPAAAAPVATAPVVQPTPAPMVAVAAAVATAPAVAAAAVGKLPSLAGLSAPVVAAPPVAPVPAVAPTPVEPPVLRPIVPEPLVAAVAPALEKPPVAAPVAAVPVAPLVAAVAPAAPVPAAPVAPYLLTTFDTLGSNAQGVLLLVRLPAAQFVKLPRNIFLNKLLQAINLVMADVVLVNVDGPYPVALQNLRKEIAATHILAFGKNLLDVAVRNTQIYEPVQFPSVGLAYLAGAEVELIEYDVSLKKRLWGGLKSMFLN